VAEKFSRRGLKLRFIFDAVRQFGADAAMKVVQAAGGCGSGLIVAFGIGGDELSVPAREFRGVYERAAALGLHRLMHAGEVGGPREIRDAIEWLGVERIGHGIATMHDAELMELLAERKIPLEVCPQSNVRTGALAKQLGVAEAVVEDHPLPLLVRREIPVVLSTDDPTMFHTTLQSEYESARRMGLSEAELGKIVEAGFRYSFAAEKT
jgi:aminodeoxyfutalosine deaminase